MIKSLGILALLVFFVSCGGSASKGEAIVDLGNSSDAIQSEVEQQQITAEFLNSFEDRIQARGINTNVRMEYIEETERESEERVFSFEYGIRDRQNQVTGFGEYEGQRVSTGTEEVERGDNLNGKKDISFVRIDDKLFMKVDRDYVRADEDAEVLYKDIQHFEIEVVEGTFEEYLQGGNITFKFASDGNRVGGKETYEMSQRRDIDLYISSIVKEDGLEFYKYVLTTDYEITAEPIIRVEDGKLTITGLDYQSQAILVPNEDCNCG